MSFPQFPTSEPTAPARMTTVRRRLLAAVVAASFALGVVFAPIAGAAPVGNGHMHPFPGCPGVSVGC